MKTRENKDKTKPIKKKRLVKPKKTKRKAVKKVSSKLTAVKVKPRAKLRAQPKRLAKQKPTAEVSGPIIPTEVEKLKKKHIERETITQESDVGLKEQVLVTEPKKEELKVLELEFPITVKDLAVKLGTKPSILIKKLMNNGLMVGINQTLQEEAVNEICREFGFRVQRALDVEELAVKIHQKQDSLELLERHLQLLIMKSFQTKALELP